METLTIEEASEARKNKAGEAYYPVKAGGKTYYLDKPIAAGVKIDADVKESRYTDKFGKLAVSRWATVLKVYSAPAAGAAGKYDLEQILGAVKQILLVLPTEWQTPDSIQGSRACAQIVDTILIEVGKGNIVLPADEGEADGGFADDGREPEPPPWERG